jgi:hypothetical protein
MENDDLKALRIGKALLELRNLLPNDGKSRIEITANYVATASEGRLAVEKTIFDDDCELHDAAAPFERLLAKVYGQP